MGVNIAEVTLHVGLGTFRPVKEDNIPGSSYAFGVLSDFKSGGFD